MAKRADRCGGSTRGPRPTPSLILGLFLVAVGVALTLDNLDLLDARAYWRYWPLVLVVIGLTKLTDEQGRVAGVIWTVIGTWLLLGNLHIVSLRFWDFWPGFVVVLIGGALIRKAIRPPGRDAIPDETSTAGMDTPGAPSAPTPSAVTGPPWNAADHSIRMFAFMGGAKRVNRSQAFRGGELFALMGGLELDLRGAAPEGGEAILEVMILMGGVEIKVDRDWTVVLSGLPLMGGLEDKTEPPTISRGKRLVIRGVVVMGGVEVSN